MKLLIETSERNLAELKPVHVGPQIHYVLQWTRKPSPKDRHESELFIRQFMRDGRVEPEPPARAGSGEKTSTRPSAI